MLDGLQGRTALVTGGASGIGEASARLLAERKANVIIADLQEERATALAAELADAGHSAIGIAMNVADESSVVTGVETASARFGALDIVVNSAGGHLRGDDAQAGWDHALGVFLRGTFLVCKHSLDHLVASERGAIVNIASIAGITGTPGDDVMSTGYNCAKHGVVGLTKSLALIYGRKGVRVNAVCPGYVITEMTRPLWSDEQRSEEVLAQLDVPLGRWGESSEIGKVVCFLASDDASFMTGQPVVVDGGFMAR
jgi:NAD(P)-dependent dehydrogenase (short-subunit alcohol dehydrogenase family)